MAKRQQSISINLLPTDQEREKVKKIGIVFAVIYLLMLLAMGSLYYWQHQQLADLEQEKQQLQTTLASFTGTPLGKSPALELKQKLQGLSEQVKNLKAKRLTASPILDDIQKNIPAQVSIVAIDAEANSIILEGLADNYGYVAEFITALQTNSRFTNLKLAKAELDDDAQVLSFTLEMEWGEKSQ